MKSLLKLFLISLASQGILFGCATTQSEVEKPQIDAPVIVSRYRVSLKDGVTTLSWHSEKGKTYSVAYQDATAVNSNWHTLGGKVSGTGDVLRVMDRVPTSATRIYRIQEVQ